MQGVIAPGDGADLRNNHARYARHTAAKLGLSWRTLDGGEGYIFEVGDGARSAVLASGPATPYVLNNAAAYSLARDKGFANDALARAGLAVIASRLFFVTERHASWRAPGREPADARAFAQGAQYPLFCKPVSGARGEFAERIGDYASFLDYLERVSGRHDAILVQEYVRGAEHRVFVMQGAALFSYRKRGPALVGDGACSVAKLYALAMAARAPSAMAPAPLSGVGFADADGRALSVDYVPRVGAQVRIEGAANRSAGGGADDFSDAPPAALAHLGLAVADALGLQLAGVDVFDISAQRDLSALVVIEANANPAIETLEDVGRVDLIEKIWSANLRAALASSVLP